jgi:hypothetical protein
MKERENNMSVEEVSLTFKTDLSLNNFSHENFEHKILLSEIKLENVKSGENLTEDVLEFMLLDYLTTNPLIKTKTKTIRNFIFLSERFLYKIFRKENLQITKQINFIKVSLKVKLTFRIMTYWIKRLYTFRSCHREEYGI